MISRFLTVIGLLSLAVGQWVSAQQVAPITLTVGEAIARAETNQPLIEQAQGAIQAAEAQVGVSQSGYYPNVSGSGSYTRVEPNQAFTFAFPGLPPSTFSLAPEDNFDVHVGLNQVVYQFGVRGVQVKLARNGVDAARIGLEQIKTSLAYQAAQSFYTVLLLEQEVKALDEQLSDLTEHLAAIQKKEQTGSATVYDVLSTEVRVAAMKSQRIEAQNQYERQLIALRTLAGFEPSQQLNLSGSFAPNPMTTSAQPLVSQALAMRPEMLQAAAAVKTAQLSGQLAAAQGLPSLSVHALAGFRNGLLPSINSLTFDWNAGVQLNVPLFQGLLRVKSMEEAQHKLSAAQASLAAESRTITTQVLQALQDQKASQDQVETSLVQLNQAEQMVSVAKVQYDVGVVTNLEYLDSQSSLEQARLTNLLAAYHEVLSEYALKEAVGDKIWTDPRK